MTDYSIFTGPGAPSIATPPPSASTAFSGSIVVGSLFAVGGDRLWLKGYRYWRADGGAPAGPQKFALWQASATNTYFPVAASSATSGALVAGAWNTVTLATPIQLTPALSYNAATGVNGNFSFTGGFWAAGGAGAAGLANGPLSFPSDGAGSAPDPYGNPQSLFSTGGSDPAVTPPNLESSPPYFNGWIDVIVSDVAPVGASYRLWPSQPFTGLISPDTNGYNMALQFSVSQACTLTRLWFFSAAGAGALPTRCALWDVASQATVAGTDRTTPGWLNAAGAPAAPGDGYVSSDYTAAGITLAAGIAYKVSAYAPIGAQWRVATNPYWSAGNPGAGGLANGPLSAPDFAHASPGQNSWAGPNLAWAYPSSAVNPENSWIDVEVTPVPPPSGPAKATSAAAVSARDSSAARTAGTRGSATLVTSRSTSAPGVT